MINHRQMFALVALLVTLSAASTRTMFAQTITSYVNPDRYHGRAKINAERGMKIILGNRTTGRITVNGWDRDVIEAHAVSERGDEVVIAIPSNESDDKKLFLKADYANVDQPSAPTIPVDGPPQANGSNLKVHFEVNVPRYIEFDVIRVQRSDVQITGVETSISVWGGQSSVILKRVGSVEARTRSGNIEIEGAGGPVSVTTAAGAVRVHRVQGNVRVVSISGLIEIKCVQGRVEVANTQGPIDLVNIKGEVKAEATNSSVRFMGSLNDEGNYDLKSMSGRVEMILPTNTNGFNATLSSYQGVIESDFKLKTNQPVIEGPQGRRLIGRFGSGRSQISLDSFDGLVRLTRMPPEKMEGCQNRE